MKHFLWMFLVVALLVCGAWASVELAGGFPGNWALATMAVAAALTLLPPVGRRVDALLDRLRHPSPLARATAAIILGIATTAFLALYAKAHLWINHAYVHDEGMFRIQAQLLARGKLWTAPHPCAEFFETFYVFVKPLYAPIYFPGTALLYAPAARMHAELSFTTAGVCGGVVALTYLVIGELLDGAAGLAAALLVLGTKWLRILSVRVFSQPVMLLLGLAMTWAWLRWRRDKKPGWAIAVGALTGWAAITRPLDAACFALPLLIASVAELRRCPWRLWLRTGACALVAAAPFLALQFVQDLRLTGHLLESPASQYLKTYLPGVSLGGHAKAVHQRPPSDLPQVGLFYDNFVFKTVREYEAMTGGQRLWRSFPAMGRVALAMPALLVLALPGILGVTDRRRAAIIAAALLFAVGYAAYPFLRPSYALMTLPALTLLVLLGAERTAAIFGPWRRRVAAALTVAIAAAAVHLIAGFPENQYWEEFYQDVLRRVNDSFLQDVRGKALVFFRFGPGEDYHHEPVYNVDAASPDQCRIVRAHDLGAERDMKLIRYYATLQPQRTAYLYVREQRKLYRLGNVRELAAAGSFAEPTATPQAPR